MTDEEVYALIGIPPDTVERLKAAAPLVAWEAAEPLLTDLMHIEKAGAAYENLRTLLGEDAGNMKMLACQLACAARAYDRFAARGIDEDIFAATMGCFTRFLEECRVRTGRADFDRGWWTYRQLSLRLFRLGTLEYELAQHDGKPAISIHIPSDADLRPQAVDGSLEMARSFFAAQYPTHEKAVYFCDSWLLAPALRDILDEDSRIRQFGARFQILHTDPASLDCMEWLFRTGRDTPPEKLCENTSLQRRAKHLLQSGGQIGTAFGILKS